MRGLQLGPNSVVITAADKMALSDGCHCDEPGNSGRDPQTSVPSCVQQNLGWGEDAMTV